MMKLEIILTLLVFHGVWAIQLTKDNLESTCKVTESEINCDNKKIDSVASDAFANHGDKILKLGLSINSIAKLEPGTFATLTKLDSLYLDSNQLTSIPVDLFKSENSLRLFSLSNNLFEAVDFDQFESYPSLKHLLFEYNRITTIKSPTKKNSALIALHLISNKIETLGKGVFNNLVSLSTLVISNNSINSIHPEFIDPGAELLSYLDLGQNKLKSLDVSKFSNFKFLSTLILHSNEISSIVGTFPFARVNSLDLSNNKLEEIKDGTFRNMSSLSTLDLNQNSLTKIPAVEIYCFKVKTLNLCGNKLDYIDQDNCKSASKIFKVWEDKYGFNDLLTCPKPATTTRSPTGNAAHVAPRFISIIFMTTLVSFLL